jgi:hypothetical protein
MYILKNSDNGRKAIIIGMMGNGNDNDTSVAYYALQTLSVLKIQVCTQHPGGI